MTKTRGQILFLITCAGLWLMMLVPRLQGYRIMDDAYMYVRYADHLLHHGEYSWNLGEGNVYGTTSVLYTLAIIPFRLICPQSASLTLVLSSFFWGLVSLALMLQMVRRIIPASPERFVWKMCFAVGLLTASSPVLSRHFGTGMETTFVLCWGAFALMLLHRAFQSGALPRRAWIGGAFAGLAFWVRPDLMVFALGLPAVLFLYRAHRKTALRWGVAAIAISGLSVLASALWLGSPVPLPFFAKNTDFYGAGITARYAGLSGYHMAMFISVHWPAALVLGMGVLMNVKRLRRRYGAGEWAVTAACLVFAAYYLFFVTPIMGNFQRFLYPLLPFVLWLSTREWMRAMEELERHSPLRLNALSRNAQIVVAVLVVAFLGFYGYQGVMEAQPLKPNKTLLHFNDLRLYRNDKNDYWFKLDELAALPEEVSIATTEVGMVAALNPGKRIVDLAGLNDPQVALRKATIGQRLKQQPPDFIYLPHPDYDSMRNELLQAEWFNGAYEVLDEQELEAQTGKKYWMGIAILKSGKYAEQMSGWLGKTKPAK
jgi:hypothetical protein